MSHPIGWGLALVVLGGMLNGSFAAPMKKLAVWRWENIWLLYSFAGLLILPWAVALATVPHLGGVFQQSSPAVMAKVALFGFAWGIGGLLFGQGLARGRASAAVVGTPHAHRWVGRAAMILQGAGPAAPSRRGCAGKHRAVKPTA